MHRLLVVAGSLLLLAGCDGCAEPVEPVSDDEPAESTTRPGTAVIEGVVRLAPGAELPREAVNPMVAPQNRPELPEHCTPPQERDREPVRQVRGDHLAGMVVAVSGFSAEVPHEPVTHQLAIRDCRLTPSAIVATLGDRLRLVNETNYPFMPEMGGGMMTALLHERDREVELGRAGMRTLACGFAASCGRTLIVTQYHPLHAVTDETGRFRIENVPVNEELRIDAWHTLFNEAGEALTLSPGETREIEIVVTPAPARPAAPPPVDPPGRAEDNPDVLF
jgi:hypothetical protein